MTIQFPLNKIIFKVRDNDIEIKIDSRNKADPLITLVVTREDALKVRDALVGAINELENKQ